MKDQIRINLTASLHSTTTDLSEIAHGLADLSADEELEQQAKTLDRIAEDANEGATILRALIACHARERKASHWNPATLQSDAGLPTTPGSSAS